MDVMFKEASKPFTVLKVNVFCICSASVNDLNMYPAYGSLMNIMGLFFLMAYLENMIKT